MSAEEKKGKNITEKLGFASSWDDFDMYPEICSIYQHFQLIKMRSSSCNYVISNQVKQL
ncbi:hypothetical protein [Okeania sp. KiyG1]|uniref:hypothetical protein n=1 Tax=Okeania sp. KiyG1 TaxID=2720165 RepID=UPI0019225D46|nr:hypothetical protein [Okeania sp. KiyG1]